MAQNRDVAFDALLITIDRLIGEVFGDKAVEIVSMDHSKCPPNHSHDVEFSPVFNDAVLKLFQIASVIVEILDDDEGRLGGDTDEVFDFWENLAAVVPSSGTTIMRVAAKARQRADAQAELLRRLFGGDPSAN